MATALGSRCRSSKPAGLTGKVAGGDALGMNTVLAEGSAGYIELFDEGFGAAAYLGSACRSSRRVTSIEKVAVPHEDLGDAKLLLVVEGLEGPAHSPEARAVYYVDGKVEVGGGFGCTTGRQAGFDDEDFEAFQCLDLDK